MFHFNEPSSRITLQKFGKKYTFLDVQVNVRRDKFL